MFTIGCYAYKTVYSSETIDNPGHVNLHKKEKRFYRYYLKKKTLHATVKYKKYINKLTKLIKAAEKSYYLCKFDNVKSDIKEIWKLIKQCY